MSQTATLREIVLASLQAAITEYYEPNRNSIFDGQSLEAFEWAYSRIRNGQSELDETVFEEEDD